MLCAGMLCAALPFAAAALPPAGPTAGPATADSADRLPADRYRPGFHFTPARNWINDPNGLVYYRGEYHLFFQHNPYGTRWGHMSWGHATSRDLVHWRERPVAIPETEVMAFSGSAVVDWRNTSRLGEDGEPPLVALYTGFDPASRRQAQYLAYSRDGGRHWIRHGDGPVLDIGSTEFRDPKVFWYAPGGHWAMAVVRATDNRVAFYRSPDLLHWKETGGFGPAGARAAAWECPDLFEIPVQGRPGETRWVLAVSVNGNAPGGGSGVQYFVGRFDGARFVPEQDWGDAPVWIDHGADFYAAATWNDIPARDGRRLMIAWATNLRYAEAIPAEVQRGAMSLPRELTLARTPEGLRLRQAPARELRALRGERREARGLALDEAELDLSRWIADGASTEVVLDIDAGDARQVVLSLAGGDGHRILLGVNPPVDEVFVDRDRAGPHVHDAFAGRHVAPLALEDGRVRLHVFVDRSIVEVFADDGRRVLTDRVFPGGRLAWTASATGGRATIRRLQAWPMRPYRDAAP